MASGPATVAAQYLSVAQNDIVAGLGTKKQADADDETRLGGGETFEPGEDYADCLKDIMRQLRREHPTKRHLYKNLGTLQVVQSKLVPLLLTCHGDDKLVFQVAKLLVMLTLPVEEVIGRQLEDRILVDYADCIARNGAAVHIFVSQLPLDPKKVCACLRAFRTRAGAELAGAPARAGSGARR